MKKLHTLTHTLSLSPFNKSHGCIATYSLIIMIILASVLQCFEERDTILYGPMKNMAAALSHRDYLVTVQGICGVTVILVKEINKLESP